MLPSAIQWVALCYSHHRKPAHGPDAAGTLRTGHDTSAPPAERAVTPHAVTPCRSGADSGEWTGHRTQSESPQAGQPREISEPAKMCQILPFQYMSLIVLRSNCLPKKKGMFKRERTCDLMILNSVTLLGGIGTRSSLARPRLVLSVPCVPGHTAAQRGRQCQAPPLTFPKRCDTSMSGRAWVHPEICGAQNHRD